MDIQYLLALQALREQTGHVLDGFFLYVSELGMPTLGLMLAAVIYWCVNKRAGAYMLSSFNLGCLLNSALKTAFCVQRPWVRSADVQPVEGARSGATGYSFPSGHTANAMSYFGTLGVATWKWKRALSWWLFALVLLIGFSRNYLGVHTPQDVAVSLLVGALLLWALPRLDGWERARAGRDRWILLAGVLLSLGLLTLTLLRQYPQVLDANGQPLDVAALMRKDAFATVGAALGFFAGWFWEKRRIGFSVEGALWRRALRGAVGVACLLLINTAGKSLLVSLLGGEWGRLAMSFLVMLFMAGLYPWLFSKVAAAAASRAERASAEKGSAGL